METATLVIVLVIVLALFFDFTNGFHDTANAMATPIATGALKPRVAVLLAAVLNLVGAFLSTEVAKTISGGMIREDEISVTIFPAIIFAGLIGAITWNMLTWLLGLPSSSSHALFGGLIGATLVGVGTTAIDFGVVMSKVILPALIAPLTAGIIAFVVTKIAYAVTRRYDAKPDGRDGFRWKGEAYVGRKSEWATWTPPREMIKRQPEAAKWARGMPGGLENPLGARTLHLYQNGAYTLYTIYASSDPESIGSGVTSGCVGLLSQDMIHLYGRTPVKTKVIVLPA